MHMNSSNLSSSSYLSNSSHLSLDMISQTPADANRLAGETTAVLLAGGKGARLGALTRHECKPALPFGAFYRNIDFSLSNCVNSAIRHIGVVTQYREASLIQHLSRLWRHRGAQDEGLVEPWRAELRAGGGSYCGTADAVFQNWDRIEALGARLVLILAGDHVYTMDYRPMLMQHAVRGADVTVGCVEIPLESAREFGVMALDSAHRICRFSEKPSHAESLPGQPDKALGSMGIYIFNRELLGRLLREDASTATSSHDFGHDLLPRLIDRAKVIAYPFTRGATVGAGYWRDVGTVGAYWRAHMELLDGIPGLRLNDASWPVRSQYCAPDRASVSSGSYGSSGKITLSLLAAGCRIERSAVRRSVLFDNVSVGANTRLCNAVVLPDAVIGRNCCLADIVIGPGAQVPDGTVIAPMNLHDGAGAASPRLVCAETDFTELGGTPAGRVHNRSWQSARMA